MRTIQISKLWTLKIINVTMQKWNSLFYNAGMCLQHAKVMIISADSEQTVPEEQSFHGLHCLPRLIRPKI